MKVGFDAKRIFFNDRGLGNYGRNLVRGLLEYNPNWDYYLYSKKPKANGPGGYFKGGPQLNLRHGPSWMPQVFNSLWRSFGLANDIKKDKINLFHGLSHELPVGIRYSNAKSIVTIHDLIFLKHPEYFAAFDRRIYLSKIKYSITHADKVIAISERTKKDIIEIMPEAYEKISVLYQTCDPLYYEKVSIGKRNALKIKFKLPENYILSVGALVPHKNLQIILEAINLGRIDIPLVIVGRGKKYRKELDNFIRRNKLTKKVIFLSDIGWISELELTAIYQMASLFVFPSLYEGFGIPIIEAMYSGVPVISSKDGCFMETGGNAATYCDSLDKESWSYAIDNILSSKEIHSKHVKMGYEHVQKFHMKPVTNKLIELYNATVNE